MNERKKIIFIINPNAGRKSKTDVEQIIQSEIDTTTIDPIFVQTQYAGHANEIATQYAKEKAFAVIAIGGDGTVNEIGKALVHTETALGIIPKGSGNGLARHLKIPLDIHKAIQVINQSTTDYIDYGVVNNEHLFFCTFGVGFDACIGHKFAQSKTRGLQAYVKTAVDEFVKYEPQKYTLKYNGLSVKERAFLITFANAAQYGNNAYISPNADIKDGLLDVCVLTPFPKHRFWEIGWRLFSKKINQTEYVDIFRAPKIKLKRKTEDVVHFDGESFVLGKKIKIKTIHQGLKVIVP